ncbi:MAG: CDGSH iron-sulfur domain-containing protein [Chitinophagales bacterium]
MEEKLPIIAQKSPYKLDVEADKNYAWCTCGKSSKQPLCDGAHKGSGMRPKVVKFEEAKTVHWCGCKHTANELGLCDGAHKGL